MIVLRARIRPKVDTGERRDLRVEAPDFHAGRDLIDEQTPDGWIRMFIITGDAPTSEDT